MGIVKKFQCPHCQGVVELEFDDEYIICGHCETAVQVPKEFGSGVVIDDFLILSLLGEGGMGNVYLAHQYSLDRKVALKILKDDFLKDPKFKDEFIYEARSVACLNHPNIIQAYKVGEEDGVVFFAMEHVEGRNLKDILKEEGAINEKLAISIAMEIVAALGYGWNLRKLVHRDIKPENIMMTNDGVAKLMDLGLSLRDGDDKDEGDMIAGTPQYISPEQILGTEMDIRGDFYCLGATLYHLVSGKMPFEGSLQQIVKQHLSDKPPSLRKVVPGIDDFFAKIIHKMLLKKPENRYESAEALLAAFKKDMKLIEDAEHGKKHFKISTQTNILTSTGTSEIRKRKKKKDPLLLASVIMVSLLVLGFLVVKATMGGGNNRVTGPYSTQTENSPEADAKAVESNPLIMNEGLYYRYFHTSSTKIDDIEKGKLISQGVTKTIFSGPPDNHPKGYGIIYDGVMKVDHSETYQFSLKVDNACRITIDNKKLFDITENDGEKTATRTLSKGFHPIKIEYRNGSGSHNLDFKVESISYNRMKVPNEWFYLNSKPDKFISIDESNPGLAYSIYKNTRFISDALKTLPDNQGVYRKVSPESPDSSIKENYVIEYDTVLKLPKTGVYTLYLTAAPKAELHLNGSPVLYDQASTEGASSVSLSLNQLNCLKLLYQDSKEHKKLILEVEGEGLDRQQVPTGWYYQIVDDEILSAQKDQKMDKVRSEGGGQIHYSYYEDIENFQDVHKKNPLKKGTLSKITNEKIGKNGKYGYLFWGSINIPEDGEYTFFLDADSEAWFGIGDQNKQNLWSGGKSKNKRFKLSKGKHNYSLTYLQKGGSSRLSLKVKSSSFPIMEVPSSWFHAFVPEAKQKVKAQENSSIQVPEQNQNKGQIKYSYYEGEFTKFSDMVRSKPKSEGVTNELNYKIGERKENYGLTFSGSFNIPKDDEYTFYIEVNDLGRLDINGKRVIQNNIDNKNSSTIKLTKGEHRFKVYYLQKTKTRRMRIYFSTKDIPKRVIPKRWYQPDIDLSKLDLQPSFETQHSSIEKGLRYTIYQAENEPEDMDEALKGKIVEKGLICSTIRFLHHTKDYSENFALVYKGFLKIPKDGNYTYELGSNDGSKMYLEDQLIIDNDGNHTHQVKSATVNLKKGFYKFKVEYFQGAMSKSFSLTQKYENEKEKELENEDFWRLRYQRSNTTTEQGASVKSVPKPTISKKKKTNEPKTVKAGQKLTISPSTSIKSKDLDPGLKYTLYKSDKLLRSIGQMLKSKKVTTGIADVVNIVKDAGKFKENYGLIYEGYLRIGFEADVKFTIRSNDDTQFYIEDQLIIDNSEDRESHITKEREVSLKNGLYKIKVIYYQDTADKFLDFFMTNTSGKLIPVNAHRLFHQK